MFGDSSLQLTGDQTNIGRGKIPKQEGKNTRIGGGKYQNRRGKYQNRRGKYQNRRVKIPEKGRNTVN